MDRNTFISDIKDAAMEGMRGAKILASLTLAQAIIESADGGSGLASEAFNLFGIKGTGTNGSKSFPTQEWDGTQMVTVDADFAAYHSWSESLAAHIQLLSGLDRYSNLVGVTDPDAATRYIWKDGYATDPEYPAKLMAIIKEENLVQYDHEVLTEIDTPEWARGARKLLMSYGITDGERPNDSVTRAEAWTMLNNLWAAEIERTKGGQGS